MTYTEAMEACAGPTGRDYVNKALEVIIPKVEEARELEVKRLQFLTKQLAVKCGVRSYILQNHDIIAILDAHIDGVEWKPNKHTVVYVEDFPKDLELKSSDLFK